VTLATARALSILSRSEQQVTGKPVSGLIDPNEARALQEFLERPARFAETSRPALVVRGIEPGTDILFFAQGQAGVITGYFGFVRKAEAAQPPALAEQPIEPALLARLSRGVRRPLNTIIGFADMIRSAALGTNSTERYAEYARDIKTAGQEIAGLVDELDDYTRLRDGRFAPRLTEIDLKALLEACASRVRSQAATARVLVRSAISERLPNVRADRGSLGQAVLNLLASAIDQTPAGGSVILSAQVGDEGAVVINVRDSGHAEADPGERFVVFRDGQGRDGEILAPARSSVGLALTRSLAAVNSCALSIDPAGGSGTLFSLTIPASAVAGGKAAAAD
jgi:signal transduction histidine kinase